jgi:curved DNA-binding protein CbpA
MDNNVQNILENKDLYRILGIDKNAKQKDIKLAYYKKSLETHPDKNGNPANFFAINLAYKILFDPENRIKYDSHYHRDKFGTIGNIEKPKYKDIEVIIDEQLLNKLKNDFNKTYEEMIDIQFEEFVEKPIEENLKIYKNNEKEIENILKTQQKLDGKEAVNAIFEKNKQLFKQQSTAIVAFNESTGGTYMCITKDEKTFERPESEEYNNYYQPVININKEDINFARTFVSTREGKMHSRDFNNNINTLKKNRTVRFENEKEDFVLEFQKKYNI